MANGTFVCTPIYTLLGMIMQEDVFLIMPDNLLSEAVVLCRMCCTVWGSSVDSA